MWFSINRKSLVPTISIVAACGLAAWFHRAWTVQQLPWVIPLPPAAIFDPSGRVSIRFPNYVFSTRVATFRDELFAYLMYQFYRESPTFNSERLLLYYYTNKNSAPKSEPEYRIDLILSGDFLKAVDRVAELNGARSIAGFEWRLVPAERIKYRQSQTELFIAAYNLPVHRKMEDLSPKELHALLRRFIRYKSTTDPRVRRRLEPVPKILGPDDAQRIASDIVEVAQFYDLPIDAFLGIGAMENNYMNVRGDLENTIWKRRPAKDDIVLQRKGGRVRVLNDSAGRWQITRETLRYVHRLFVQDKRDYNRLSQHLRPPRELDINHVDPYVLTTYAGLLLRELLDHYNGDISLAVGAYNGGTANPNKRYEKGVRAAAEHARSILERAAALNGESVMRMRWLTAR